MADLSACRRLVKRQIFRRNESFLLLVLIVVLLFIFFMYQKEGCDDKEESFRQFGIKRNEQSISLEMETFLFIVILTSPNGVDRRNAIRETWLSNVETLDSAIVTKFIIGVKELPLEHIKSLEDENNLYQDILFLQELKDAYKELPSKVLQTFKWIDQNVNSSYILKVDDDSFVRLDHIISELKSTHSARRFYWGFFRGDAHVKFSGPWSEKSWHLCDRYLPYAQGGGYILSGDLVNFIARNADLLQKFNSEDVSVGKLVTHMYIVLINYRSVKGTVVSWFVCLPCGLCSLVSSFGQARVHCVVFKPIVLCSCARHLTLLTQGCS